MNRVLAIVAVLSLFVAGIAIGALGMRIYDDRQQRHFDDSPRPGGGFVGRHLHRMLDLSAEQMQKIDAILEHSHAQAMELRDDLHPRVLAIMDRAHEEIAGVLNPEQRDRFRQLLQDNRRRAERWFLGPPEGGHGRGRRGPWSGPGRRPWGPPPHDGSPPGGEPSERPDDAAPDRPSEPPPDPQGVPGGD